MTTTSRGYGWAHQQLREQLLPLAWFTACPRCGKPMLPGQPLDLDHTDDRTSYLGMSHARCNRGHRRGKHGGGRPRKRRQPRIW